MGGTLHRRHLENLADIIAGRKSSLDLLLAGILSEYGIFTGATSKKAGTNGLVPAPSAGDEMKFLRGDGTWAAIKSGNILDTVRATVNGGLWYEVDDTGKPVPKIYYNGIGYALITSGTEDPQLKVTVKKNGVVDIGSSTTATVTHKGVGEVIVVCSDSRVEWTRKDTNGKITITIPYSAKVDAATFTVRLLPAGDYKAATKEFTVGMQLRNPNLNVTWTSSDYENTTIVPYYGTLNGHGHLKGRVTYDDTDDGEVTVTSNSSRVKPEYDSATRVFTVPYASGVDTAEITVEITETSTFQKATKTYTVTMQRLPDVKVSETNIFNDGDDIIFTIDYDGDGELTVESSHKEVKPTKTLTATGAIVTVPYHNFGVVTYVSIYCEIARSADGKYAEVEDGIFAYYYPPPIVKSTFDTSVTEDLVGTSWQLSGTANIVDGSLSLDAGSSLFRGITVGERDFVIKGSCSFGVSTGLLFNIDDTVASKVCLSLIRTNTTTFQLGVGDKGTTFSLSTHAFRFAVTYQHEAQVTTFYKADAGKYEELAKVTERSISRKSRTLYLGGEGSVNIGEFIVYDGTTLHEKEIKK